MDWLKATSSFKKEEIEVKQAEERIIPKKENFLDQFVKRKEGKIMLYDGELVADYYNRNKQMRRRLTTKLELKQVKFDLSEVFFTFAIEGESEFRKLDCLPLSYVSKYSRFTVGSGKKTVERRYFQIKPWENDSYIRGKEFVSSEFLPFYSYIEEELDPFDLSYSGSEIENRVRDLNGILSKEPENEGKWLELIGLLKEMKQYFAAIEASRRGLSACDSETVALEYFRLVSEFSDDWKDVLAQECKGKWAEMASEVFLSRLSIDFRMNMDQKLSIILQTMAESPVKQYLAVRYIELLLSGGFRETALSLFRALLEVNLMKEKRVLNNIEEYKHYLKDSKYGLGDFEEGCSYFSFKFNQQPSGEKIEKVAPREVNSLEDLLDTKENYRPLSMTKYESGYDSHSYVGAKRISDFIFIEEGTVDTLLDHITVFLGFTLGNKQSSDHETKEIQAKKQIIHYIERFLNFVLTDRVRKDKVELILCKTLSLIGEEEKLKNILRNSTNTETWLCYAKHKKYEESVKIIEFTSN